MQGGRDELKEVLDSIDIEAWCDREGLRYKKVRGSSGLQLNVRTCPKCGNDKWKVYVGAESGLGNCFAGDCETKFSKWSFIQAVLGTDNRATVQHVKQVAMEQGWRAPSLPAGPQLPIAQALKLPDSIELPYGGRNLKYLDNRNITGAYARYFGLRFSHRGVFMFSGHDGKPRSQDYSNRVIIPVFDLEGNLVSFQGRDITGLAEQKYLFPPGFSSTGTHLYNGHNAKGAQRIVMGEGAFDVAAIKIAMDEEPALREVVPVGTFGKHLSKGDVDSQLGKLAQLKAMGLREVTFMWDGETKALRDAITNALEVHKIGIVARVATLPKDKDPNEVAPQVVRDTFYQARVVTPMTAAKMLLELPEVATVSHQ